MSDVSTMSSLALRSAYRTDPGRLRTNNEDLPLFDPDRGVYGVIDGVGGHVAGELAAAIARDVITQRLARPLGTPAERVREAIAIANNEIFKRAERRGDLRGMTCVVTLAIVSDGTSDHRTRGRQPFVQVERLRHPQDHARPFAGWRARRRRRDR